MDLELTGKTALVTGASRGIGLAIAQGLASVDEIADTVVYLASTRASYISGTIVTVDGGRAVRNAS